MMFLNQWDLSWLEGNNVDIYLDLDTHEEVDKYSKALSEGGKEEMEPQDVSFLGVYFGSCIDKFGINWVFSCSSKP